MAERRGLVHISDHVTEMIKAGSSPEHKNICGCAHGDPHVRISNPRDPGYWLCHYSLVTFALATYVPRSPRMAVRRIGITPLQMELNQQAENLDAFHEYLKQCQEVQKHGNWRYRVGPELVLRLWRGSVMVDTLIPLDGLPIHRGESKCVGIPCRCHLCDPNGPEGKKVTARKQVEIAKRVVDGSSTLYSVRDIIASYTIEMSDLSPWGTHILIDGNWKYVLAETMIQARERPYLRRIARITMNPAGVQQSDLDDALWDLEHHRLAAKALNDAEFRAWAESETIRMAADPLI